MIDEKKPEQAENNEKPNKAIIHPELPNTA
jgi:hypothetical protein